MRFDILGNFFVNIFSKFWPKALIRLRFQILSHFRVQFINFDRNTL